MCRSIHNLFNFDPPATQEEVRAAALQFVRKVSGFTHPSQANSEAFTRPSTPSRGTARSSWRRW